ncbi:MAG: ribosome small subunit-dependent GTPase A [Pirellulales bacterium]
MGKKSKSKKVRVEFRKNRSQRVREGDFTRKFKKDELDHDQLISGERISGKGDISRKRTIHGVESVETDSGTTIHLDVDRSQCTHGRVLKVQGLVSEVMADDSQVYQCATRRLLKTLSTDQRHVVAAGDRVWIRTADNNEGIIESVEPRYGVLSRTSKNRQHVIVANVDQLLIITSAGQPTIKPNLIDRYIVTAEKAGIRPVICINKIDLVDPADLQPLAGVYGQLGYEVLLLSATLNIGIDRLRDLLKDRESVLSGQSGVGKSTLLNAIEPGLQLRVGAVSSGTDKGRHTTTTAALVPLSSGGDVVDTPGIRQFQLWDVIPEEVAGFFRDIRPLINSCKYPNCSHTHENGCAVKHAVADGYLDTRRYESFCQIQAGEME